MDTLTARPRLLKQANLSLIRNVIKNKGTVTRAEIARETQISSTTVRSLLSEMMEKGEIESVGYDESSGGRKAERYSFKADRYYSVAFCMTDHELHALLINVWGEILEVKKLDANEENLETTITSYLDVVMLKKEIKSIGLGVPGAVEGIYYWKKHLYSDKLKKINIGEKLYERYKIPIVMENDINAITIGLGRCYLKEHIHEDPQNTNMAYIQFEKGCVSAGFIAGGNVVRGSQNFAGELGLIPMENNKLLDECMYEPLDNEQYVKLAAKILYWVCGILNPQYIALSGSDLRTDCIGIICDELYTYLPKYMLAEIVYSANSWHDYHDGMAYLTSKKMFDEVSIRKE